MELENFISETIKSIIAGTVGSTEFAKEKNALINPLLGFHDNSDEGLLRINDAQQRKRIVSKIDFDVAVTASNEEGNKVGGGLKIQVLNLGASTSNNATNQTSSRIKFSVNIALPNQE